ncbi:MAG: hypothetical protein A3G79_02640 [Gallionellales bacterium RIFCSPLOWO2_12_FULL_57_18]|nr:MAG: hypothetical protein A3G79_02640 [Gallionellales bacterium RIFCSPLOWO2_12_FULL_57_18]OGS94263.1 MAG: hypothetical protein A3H31_03895 [Gallionellales bacterium RIFCSPLOWO2_02_FULL_57_47]OGT12595.1 MAG: hypothetical protein A3J49_10925 [Gallionellales bacterium RIFCSPHIGHO2_02_FULL_57_16]
MPSHEKNTNYPAQSSPSAWLNIWHALWACTLLYGLLDDMGEGSERALISLYADERERDTAFGWYHLAFGLSAIPAGVLALLCALLLRFWSFSDPA